MNAQDSSSDEISLAESPKTTSSCFCSGFENTSASLRCSFLAILLTINGNLAGSTRLIIATANFKLDTKKKRINNNSRMIKESLVNYRLVRINIPFSLSILEKKKKLIYNYPERGVMPRQQKQANSVFVCLLSSSAWGALLSDIYRGILNILSLIWQWLGRLAHNDFWCLVTHIAV